MITGLGTKFLSVSVGAITGRSWQRFIQKALRENDPDKLVQYVHASEIAMFFRWQELEERMEPGEIASMRAATDNLLAIKIHKLGWPQLRGL
jgi:hypothetical protein